MHLFVCLLLCVCVFSNGPQMTVCLNLGLKESFFNSACTLHPSSSIAQVEAEFARLTSVDLKGFLFAVLDHYGEVRGAVQNQERHRKAN